MFKLHLSIKLLQQWVVRTSSLGFLLGVAMGTSCGISSSCSSSSTIFPSSPSVVFFACFAFLFFSFFAIFLAAARWKHMSGCFTRNSDAYTRWRFRAHMFSPPAWWMKDVAVAPAACWGGSGLRCRLAEKLMFEFLSGWVSSLVLSVIGNANIKQN